MKRRAFNGISRIIVLGLTKPVADPPPGTREATLRAAALKRSFLGLLIGVLIGVGLVVLLLAGD